MSYQLRHKVFGIFQGAINGYGFWYPTSKQPELGYYEFQIEEDAANLMTALCKPGAGNTPMNLHDFVIEPFCNEESDCLRRSTTTQLEPQ